MNKVIRVRVAGKLMLAGEYAVLEGGRALAVCVDRWLTATVRARGDGAIVAHSELWPAPRPIDLTIDDDPRQEPLVHAVAAQCGKLGLQGLDVSIHSDLDVKAGLGSSSALRIAVAAALSAWNQGLDEQRAGHPSEDAASLAYSWQRAAQGVASGYDIATQSTGGIVVFTPPQSGTAWPGSITKLAPAALNRLAQSVQVFVGGQGAPTGPQTRQTRAWLAATQRTRALLELSERLVSAWIESLGSCGPARADFYALIGAHRQLLAEAPGQPTQLLADLARLPECDTAWSYKTTGAGGEDALLLVGPPAARQAAAELLAASGWSPLAAGFTDAGPERLEELAVSPSPQTKPAPESGTEAPHHA